MTIAVIATFFLSRAYRLKIPWDARGLAKKEQNNIPIVSR